MPGASIPRPMPVLPRPGQQVRWRNPQQARSWGWEDVFGAGPFRVLGIVHNSNPVFPTGLLLHTDFGDQAICELWLALTEEPEETGVSQTSATCVRASGSGETESRPYA